MVERGCKGRGSDVLGDPCRLAMTAWTAVEAETAAMAAVSRTNPLGVVKTGGGGCSEGWCLPHSGTPPCKGSLGFEEGLACSLSRTHLTMQLLSVASEYSDVKGSLGKCNKKRSTVKQNI